MRRWLVLTAIAAVFGLGLSVASPPGAAHAACTSSIQPECQPANLPILIEAGVISAGAKTAATAVLAGVANSAVAPAGAMANLTFNAAAAGLGMAAITTVVGGGEALGALFSNGMHDQVITTDESYTLPGSNGNCPVYQLRLVAASSGGLCTAAPGYSVQFQGATWSTSITDIQADYRPNNTIDVSVRFVLSAAVANGWVGVHAVCRLGDEVTFGPFSNIYTPGTNNVSGPKTGTSNIGCSAGRQAVGLIYTQPAWDVRATGDNQDWFANTQGFVPPVGDTVSRGVFMVHLECMAGGVVRTQLYSQRAEWEPGDKIPLGSVLCTSGEMAVGLKLTWTPDGGETIEIIPSGQVADSLKNLPLEYPDCFGASSGCVVELYKIMPSGGREYCGPIAAYCPDWAKTNPATIGNEYECKFGTYVIPLDNCSMYRAPDVGILPNAVERPGQVPQILPPSAPVPDPLPNPIKNPDTQAPLPSLPTLPQPDTGEDSLECWPSGWGVFNPLSWIAQPVSCVMRDAFQPRPSAVTTATTTLKGLWTRSTPGQYVEQIGGLHFQGASGCEGLAINMSWIPYANVGTFYFLPACPGDFFGNIAPLFKVFMYGSLAIGGFLGISRQVSGLVNSRGLGGGGGAE